MNTSEKITSLKWCSPFISTIGLIVMPAPSLHDELAEARVPMLRVQWAGSGQHQVVVLARTSPLDPEHRHAGFSQFLVPTDADGVTIDPIVTMDGEHHFNETTFADVFVSDADVLGEIGDGWHQVTAELSYERSGPERILSTAPLLLGLLQALSRQAAEDGVDDRTAAAVGDLVARLISLRQLSVSVARTLAAGGSAANRRRWSRTWAPASSRIRWTWRPI